jgi:hypothetical protein
LRAEGCFLCQVLRVTCNAEKKVSSHLQCCGASSLGGVPGS